MFFDIGIGIVFAIATGKLFSLELTIALVLWSVLFSLLPDIDFVFELIKHRGLRGKESHKHRDILHYPILFILITGVVWWLFGNAWAFLFGLNVFLHFLHDSIGIGWGIKWLAPFSNKSYKFFAEKNGSFSFRGATSWDEDELEEATRQRGDPDWIKNIYLRLHPIAVVEIATFLFALVLLFFVW